MKFGTEIVKTPITIQFYFCLDKWNMLKNKIMNNRRKRI